MENKDRNREKIIKDLFSLLEYIDRQIQSRQSILNSECEKYFKFSISQVKEILETGSGLRMQYTDTTGENLISNKKTRFSESKKDDYTNEIIDVHTKSNQKELEKIFVTKSEFECKVQQSKHVQDLRMQVEDLMTQVQQLKEQIQAITVQVQQNNLPNFQLLSQTQPDKETVEKKSNNQSEVGIPIQTKLENETKATGISQSNTIESITLSQEMQKQMDDIVQKDSTCNYFDSLKFILKDADEWAQHPRPFQNIDEAKKVPLRFKVGNAQFNGIQAKEESYCFLVPIKSMVWNKKNLMEKGYEEFFQIDSSDDLKGTYTTIILKKPAIIEKRQDGLYYLVERGNIQVKQ